MRFSGETRAWTEWRDGFNYGREADLSTTLVRHRLSVDFTPAKWFHAAAMLQDTRAPGYGRPRPGTAQDPNDLHEAYVELRPGAQGWGFLGGRKRTPFGNSNFIGVPEWSNSGRTYDTAQLIYRESQHTVRLMTVSAIFFDPARFNVPRFRDRLTGVYYERGKDLDVWVLRHSRINNRATNSFGTRWVRRYGKNWRSSLEGVVQANAFGSVVSITRSFATKRFGRIDTTLDHEYASPDFDQLYPAAHNRIGHADVLSFRNLHSLQSTTKVPVWKGTLNIMYTANWLADPRRPAYGFTGQALPRGPLRRDRLAAQELAFYTTHTVGHLQLGLGYAEWWHGSVLRSIGPASKLRYTYVHTALVF